MTILCLTPEPTRKLFTWPQPDGKVYYELACRLSDHALTVKVVQP